MKEDYQNREKRKKKIEEENITKEEEKNRQIRIFKKRAEELKYSLDKTEKGDVFTAKWRGRTIGVYTGKGLPTPTLEKLKANKFNWELMNRLAERTAPYNVFKLYEDYVDVPGKCKIVNLEDIDDTLVPKNYIDMGKVEGIDYKKISEISERIFGKGSLNFRIKYTYRILDSSHVSVHKKMKSSGFITFY